MKGDKCAYTGREYDRETGGTMCPTYSGPGAEVRHALLARYKGGHAPRARYYMPEIGRFIQSDPIKFRSGDANFYAYTGSSPISLTDPFGLSWIDHLPSVKDVIDWLGLVGVADVCDPKICSEVREICEGEFAYWLEQYNGSSIKANTKMILDYNQKDNFDGVRACMADILEYVYQGKLDNNSEDRFRQLNECVAKGAGSIY